MRLGLMVFLVPAVLLSAGVALLAQHSLNVWHQAEGARPASGPAEQAILVAGIALPAGRILKAGDLMWQAWPKAASGAPYVPQGSRNIEDFVGSVVRTPLVPGEPITANRVVAPRERGFLATIPRPGMRAASVAVTPASGVSGFVFPGDQVDVLLTHNLVQSGADGMPLILAPDAPRRVTVTETVLRGIRVLGIDQKLDGQKLEGKPGEAVLAHMATVEVTLKQSEALALAAEMGKLSLSLRSLSDDAATPEPETGKDLIVQASYTLDDQVSRFAPPLPLPKKEREAAGLRVVVLHGAKAGDPSLQKSR